MFVPDYVFDTVNDIPVELFVQNGIKAVFFDIDNTLVPYEEEFATEANKEYFNKLKEKNIGVMFVSNNSVERVEKYSKELGYLYEADAGKPKIRKYIALARRSGVEISECAVVGDQIFTDVVSASRLRIPSFLVKPIKDKRTLFFRFKRFMEKPFLRIYNKRLLKK